MAYAPSNEGELLPSSPLSEYQLAATLQLSRTPVREAIKRLEKEGLVRSIPSRGTFITELTAHDRANSRGSVAREQEE